MTPEEQAHEQLLACAQLFNRHIRDGDGAMAAYWLNRYHDYWDTLEKLGVEMRVNLPEVPSVIGRPMQNNNVTWDAHQGFEEPKPSVDFETWEIRRAKERGWR